MARGLSGDRSDGRPEVRLEVDVESIAEPDPREPVEPVELAVWRYDSTTPVAALSPPDPEVSRRVAELATAPYDVERNWAAASVLAQELGPDRVTDLLATTTHPPAVPGIDRGATRGRIRTATTLTAARGGGIANEGGLHRTRGDTLHQ